MESYDPVKTEEDLTGFKAYFDDDFFSDEESTKNNHVETNFFKMFDLDDPGNEPAMADLPKTDSVQDLEKTTPDRQAFLEEYPSSPFLLESLVTTPQASQSEQPMQSVEIVIKNSTEAFPEHSTYTRATDQTQAPDVLQSLESLEISDSPSAEPSVDSSADSRPRISLRKRKQIQLHPFTVEKYKFKSMLHGTSVRRLVSVADPQSTQDPSDTEFVPGTLEEEPYSLDQEETQLTNEPTQAMSTTQPHSSLTDIAFNDKNLVTYSKRKRNQTRTPKASHTPDVFAFDPNPSFVKTNSSHIDAILGEFEDLLDRKAPPKKTVLSDNDTHMSVDDESDEDEPVYFRRKRLRRRVDTDEENDEKEEEKDDSIFDFPKRFDTTHYPNLRPSDTTENDHGIVIQQDDLEHRPTRKRRNRMADLRKNKNMLKGVLPASFLNVYQKELNEEEMARKASAKRATSSKGKKPEKKMSRLDEPFDAFLGSQTSYLYNEQSTPKEGLSLGNTNDEHSQASLFDFKPAETASYATRILQPRISNYLSGHSEAIEDNRVFQYGNTLSKKSTQSRINTYLTGRNEGSDHRIQTLGQSSGRKQAQHSVSTSLSKPPQRLSKVNGRAHKKKRKARKRTMDDIYVHQYRHVRPRIDPSLMARRSYPNQTLDDIGVSSKRVYNDDHMTVQKPPVVQWVRDMAEYLRSTKNAASLNPLPKYTQSLEQIVDQLQHVFDPDLRCTAKLSDTVYLHHRLLQPLLSTQPNAKRAYTHLKTKLDRPCVFSRNIVWTSIYHRRSHIQSLFQHAAREVTKAGTDLNSEPADIPDLDTFYTFVSVYLTQWLPLQEPGHVMVMTEVFGQEVREMAHRMRHIASTKPVGSWRLIVKTMLFVLDWTCRLHLIGINPEQWSVTRCTTILIDILVAVGYVGITTRENPFVIEAWVCLFQIMTVSSNSGGYYFSDESLLQQFRNAIHRKNNNTGWIDQGTSLETCWTHAFQHILETYM